MSTSSLSRLHFEGRYHSSLSGSVDFQPAAGKVWFIREFVLITTATSALTITHFSEDGAEDGLGIQTLQTFTASSANTFEDKGGVALGDESFLRLKDTGQTGFGHFLAKGVVVDEAETTPKAIKIRLVGGSGDQEQIDAPAADKAWLFHDIWYWWYVNGSGSGHEVDVRDAASDANLEVKGTASELTPTDLRPLMITDQMELQTKIFGGSSQFDSARDVLELLALAEEVDLDT